MKINDNIEITNENNLDLMKRYSDKYFDLPPSQGFYIWDKNSRKIFLWQCVNTHGLQFKNLQKYGR